MQRTIVLDGRKIEYEFLRKKVKNMNLRVRADGSVVVSAAKGVPIDAVEAFLRAQSGRILRALDRFAAAPKHTMTTAVADGETFLLLGRPVLLRLAAGAMPSARLAGTELILTLPEPEKEGQREQLFQQWSGEMCKTVFGEACDRLLPLLVPYEIARPAITVRSMTTRWGSCRPQKGAITLNRRLLEYPIATIEFVVMHELVHFVHPNHSQRFYELLTALMPNWREREKPLKPVSQPQAG